MDIYYKKIMKKSILSMIMGICIDLFFIYMIWRFVLEPNLDKKDNIVFVFGMLLLSVLIMLYTSLRGVGILKKSMEKSGLEEKELVADLEKGKDFEKCNVGKRYAIGCSIRPEVILLENVLVVHSEIRSTTRRRFRRSYIYRIIVVEQSGEIKTLEAQNEEELQQIFESIMEIVPYAITKYDKAIQVLRKKNLPELVKIVEERKANYEG